MANLISASRRTDIPRFYARWFAERRRAGWAEFRNAFGGGGRVSLSNEDVTGYLFWTRYARPFAKALRDLLDEGIPCAFQYTINGYGREIEPHSPRLERALADFVALSARLPAPPCIQWRYDPILLSDQYRVDDHLRRFRRIATALSGATRVVNTSIVEPYLKTVRRLADPTVRYRDFDPKQHPTVAARYPHLGQIAGDAQPLLEGLAAIAAENGMELRVCSNPEYALPQAQCCSVESFAPYGAAVVERVATLQPGPSRAGCRCLKTVDIGMDNTCIGGCDYCYVVQSQPTALRNYQHHDPAAARLR